MAKEAWARLTPLQQALARVVEDFLLDAEQSGAALVDMEMQEPMRLKLVEKLIVKWAGKQPQGE